MIAWLHGAAGVEQLSLPCRLAGLRPLFSSVQRKQTSNSLILIVPFTPRGPALLSEDYFFLLFLNVKPYAERTSFLRFNIIAAHGGHAAHGATRVTDIYKLSSDGSGPE